MDFFSKLMPHLIWGGIFLVITHILAWCSMKRILLIEDIVKMLDRFQNTVLLSCRENKVSTIGTDQKEYVLWWGILGWKGGQRTVQVVKKAAKEQYDTRLGAWFLLALPAFLISIYWGIYHHQNAFAITLMVGIEQVFPFYIGPDILGAVQTSLD